MENSKILNELILIISELSHDYPEIYRNLEEEFFGLKNDSNLSVTEYDLRSYLDSLKTILKNYKKNHMDKLSIYPDKDLFKGIYDNRT